MKNQFTTNLSSCAQNASPAPGLSPHPPCRELHKPCDSNTTLTTRHFTGTHTAQISSKKNYATTTLTPTTLPPSLNSSNPNAICTMLDVYKKLEWRNYELIFIKLLSCCNPVKIKARLHKSSKISWNGTGRYIILLLRGTRWSVLYQSYQSSLF
jgi:hypothetical protein